MSRNHSYDTNLDKNPANHAPLTPLVFLDWTAQVHPDRLAMVHGKRRYTWAQTAARCRRLASALAARGIGPGDTVAVMAANTPEMVEAHFGVPMTGAVLNTLNTRLDAESIAFMLDHGEARPVIADREFSAPVEKALALAARKPLVVHIVPADGDTVGEIVFRGNITMKGYLKNPKATEDAFAGGWFHSGDLAVLQPDRYVKIKDRAKDVIISGGENISSVEVEEVLYRHPAVLAVGVVAQPDAKWGESPLAYVELRPGAATAEDELIEHCRAQMDHYKVPRRVVFGPLPKTSTGKIQKHLLRQRAKSASAIE